MAGVTGREVKAAYARCNTWGTPASVTRQLLISSSDGLDNEVGLIDEDAFSQDFLGEAEVGDSVPRTPELAMQARFEDVDTWVAAACGSAASPSVVSSVAANSLVAYSHTITLAKELTHFFTGAIMMGDPTQYVLEVPSFKIRGFSLRTGDNGRMQFGFPIVGNKATYTSSVNINSTVGGARAASLGNRLLRKNGRIRMNVQSGGALGTSDEIAGNTGLRDLALTYTRPMAQDDIVFGGDSIIEPDDDGFAEFMLEVTFPRMNTVSANSLAVGLQAGRIFKGDLRFLGPYINSTTQREFLLEMPALQLATFRAPITGHNQVRPTAQFRLKAASAAPTGMSGLTNPFRIQIVNANSANLLS